MSNKEINIEIGRPLDKLIAEVVFGAEVEVLNQKAGYRIDLRAKNNEFNDPIMSDWGVMDWRLKSYSKNIEFAMEIVEKLGRNGTQWRFSNKAHSNQFWWAYTEDGCCQGDTLAHAICLVALKHIGEQANVTKP